MRVLQIPVGRMQNFAYVIADEDGEAVLVDPAWDVAAILDAAKGLRITRILATHGHGDHINGIAEAAKRTGARVLAHASADHLHDEALNDGDVIHAGKLRIRVIHAPGHRFDAVLYVLNESHVLTGDTLFVGECGRVDLPGSDPKAMHHSLVHIVRSLPDELVVLPGHDYGKTPTSTIGREKAENDTLRVRSLDAFLKFMAE